MANITDEDILKLAQLSKISVTDDEVHKFRDEIGAIVGYVEQLSKVEVEGLEPTNQVTGLKNVMREDEIRDYVSKDELLKNAPAREGDLIKVKRVLE